MVIPCDLFVVLVWEVAIGFGINQLIPQYLTSPPGIQRLMVILWQLPRTSKFAVDFKSTMSRTVDRLELSITTQGVIETVMQTSLCNKLAAVDLYRLWPGPQPFIIT